MATSKPHLAINAEWGTRRLGQITTKIGSGSTPRGGAAAYLPQREHWVLVRSQNVFDRYFDRTGLAAISNDQASRMRSVALQPGDLLLNITGDGVTFARACEVPSDVIPAVVNQHVCIVRVDPEVACPGFVLGYLTSPSAKSYIESFNPGGRTPAVFAVRDQQAHRVDVRVGELIEGRVAVEGSLSDEDVVVVAGHSGLLDGDEVEVMP